VGCSRSGDLRSDLPDAQPLLFSKQWRRSRRRKVQIDTLLAREGKGRRMEFDVLALAAKISEERERERERERGRECLDFGKRREKWQFLWLVTTFA
jgi:hypothetical protein